MNSDECDTVMMTNVCPYICDLISTESVLMLLARMPRKNYSNRSMIAKLHVVHSSPSGKVFIVLIYLFAQLSRYNY